VTTTTQDHSSSFRLQKRREAIADLLGQVATWSIAKFARWAYEGDEPDDDASFAAFVSRVVCTVASLRSAYAQCKWTDLARDLNSFRSNDDALEAVLRIQCCHVPLVHVRMAGTSGSLPWLNTASKEVCAGLAKLDHHCSRPFHYGPEEYYIEDTVLGALVRGLKDLSQECAITKMAATLRSLSIKPRQAPMARDKLRLIVVPECWEALRSWCKTRNVAFPGIEAKPCAKGHGADDTKGTGASNSDGTGHIPEIAPRFVIIRWKGKEYDFGRSLHQRLVLSYLLHKKSVEGADWSFDWRMERGRFNLLHPRHEILSEDLRNQVFKGHRDAFDALFEAVERRTQRWRLLLPLPPGFTFTAFG
jgi:hypothetical protein